jgi:hypothetical protein
VAAGTITKESAKVLEGYRTPSPSPGKRRRGD